MGNEGDQFAGTSLLPICPCSGDDMFVCDAPHGNGIGCPNDGNLIHPQGEGNRSRADLHPVEKKPVHPPEPESVSPAGVAV